MFQYLFYENNGVLLRRVKHFDFQFLCAPARNTVRSYATNYGYEANFAE
jgi:hypothetical protein